MNFDKYIKETNANYTYYEFENGKVVFVSYLNTGMSVKIYDDEELIKHFYINSNERLYEILENIYKE